MPKTKSQRHRKGTCANCGRPIWQSTNGKWTHIYTVSDRCPSGRKIMPAREKPEWEGNPIWDRA